MNRGNASLPILVLALVASLSSIGCIGITSAAKPALNVPSASPTSHFVKITWSPSTSEVATYNVYRSTSAGGPFSKIATTVGVRAEYIDDNVEAGATYYYAITSVAADGMESTDSALAIATIP